MSRIAVERRFEFRKSNGGERERDEEREEEEDEDEEGNGRGLEAWERAYADERSWESLQEDESGLLRPIDSISLHHAQYRRRLRSSFASSSRIQKGLIRYLYVVVDLSRAASETDFRPSRMVVVAKHVEAFIREFFDQNPLSHIGLVTIKDGIAQCLTDLGGSPDSHIKALLGDIMETIQNCKKAKIRCSVVGLSAEIYICKHLCEETGGSYSVALDESHFKELLLEHAPPPPAIAEFAVANLIKMGFPQRGAEGVISICSCHKEAKVGGGYTCPRCKARVCELPTECRICGLTLVSSPHLARSYHHLFPITPFTEVPSSLPSNSYQRLPKLCFGCQQSLPNPGSDPALRVACPKCKQHFCLDCDIYIHESLHNCPGCESLRESKPSETTKEWLAHSAPHCIRSTRRNPFEENILWRAFNWTLKKFMIKLYTEISWRQFLSDSIFQQPWVKFVTQTMGQNFPQLPFKF